MCWSAGVNSPGGFERVLTIGGFFHRRGATQVSRMVAYLVMVRRGAISPRCSSYCKGEAPNAAIDRMRQEQAGRPDPRELGFTSLSACSAARRRSLPFYGGGMVSRLGTAALDR